MQAVKAATEAKAFRAVLALEDGNYFEGEGFGAETRVEGEVCFNTSLTGYQEILTDPSYAGQLVTLTYPEIGNYGVNVEDIESTRIQATGLIVKNVCPYPSNYRTSEDKGAVVTVSDYLKAQGIPGIQGIDTRRLTRILRETGAKNGVLVTGDYDLQEVLAAARKVRSLSETDYVAQVTVPASCDWDTGEHEISFRPPAGRPVAWTIAAIDYGAKHNILRKLRDLGATVIRFPATATAADVLAVNPDGILLSNGPGDPAVLDYAVETIRGLVGKRPIFGICLGHQLLARALGGSTFKLKFGHRGANHPVQDLRTAKVEITSQNHGFAVDPNSLDAQTVEVTHVNLNDNTVAGLRHKTFPAFSVQYHPEASPGPKDSHYLFEEFLASIEEFAQKGKI
jgi:carbamoyl-phosphate synthase small subunit